MKILNIEDDQTQAETLARLLKKVSNSPSLEVVNATNLTDGLRLSISLHANVTLLDLGIPLFEGGPILPWREVASTIPNMIPPVIVVSGLDINANDFEIKFECFRQGAQRIFEKPFANKLLSWFWNDGNSMELFAERLLDAAGAAHLRNVLGNGKQNGKT